LREADTSGVFRILGRGGGRAKDARFEATEAPMGGVWGGGVPSPLKKGSGEGAVPPEIFKKIFGSMCSKYFCVQAKGGGHRPVPPYIRHWLIPRHS